jgi:hypothetical protein
MSITHTKSGAKNIMRHAFDKRGRLSLSSSIREALASSSETSNACLPTSVVVAISSLVESLVPELRRQHRKIAESIGTTSSYNPDVVKEAEELKREATSMFSAGNLNGAVSRYTESFHRLRHGSLHDIKGLLHKRGQVYLSLGDPGRALWDSLACIYMDSSCMEGHIVRIKALIIMDKTDYAMLAVDTALSIDPTSAAVLGLRTTLDNLMLLGGSSTPQLVTTHTSPPPSLPSRDGDGSARVDAHKDRDRYMDRGGDGEEGDFVVGLEGLTAGERSHSDRGELRGKRPAEEEGILLPQPSTYKRPRGEPSFDLFGLDATILNDHALYKALLEDIPPSSPTDHTLFSPLIPTRGANFS